MVHYSVRRVKGVDAVVRELVAQRFVEVKSTDMPIAATADGCAVHSAGKDEVEKRRCALWFPDS